MNFSIFYYVTKAKNNDSESIIYLINKFQPLIIKHAVKFSNFEDTKSDITLHFIKTIKKIPLDLPQFHEDKYIISYINKSILNYCNLLYKKSLIYSNFEYIDNIEIPEQYINNSNLIFYDLISPLNSKEKLILEKKYIYSYTNAEIARMLNLSRQNVQACLTRAITKLRNKIILAT